MDSVHSRCTGSRRARLLCRIQSDATPRSVEAGLPLFRIAIELVTVSRAELIGPQRFRLSGFLRGLGGSEAAAGRHLPAGSRVVLLDGAMKVLSDDLAEIGRILRLRIGPAQADVGDPAMLELVVTVGAEALKPFAPVRVTARRSGAGISLNWVRRTRVDGDSWDLAEVPLGE